MFDFFTIFMWVTFALVIFAFIGFFLSLSANSKTPVKTGKAKKSGRKSRKKKR